MSDLAPGILEMDKLRAANFSSDDLSSWRQEKELQLRSAGFQDTEISDYFGESVADFSGAEKLINDNLKKRKSLIPSSGVEDVELSGGPIKEDEVREADSFISALESGFDISVSGLIAQGKPDVVLSENAPMFYRIASGVGTLAGDIPAMVAGSLSGSAAGAAAGSAVPIVGTVAGGAVGAAAGAFALPEAWRTYLMEKYEKGEVKSFSDFWSRASSVFISGLKGGTIGAVTGGVGGVVGKVAGRAALGAGTTTVAKTSSEILTMTTVGSALEGEIPEPEHFLDAAILIGGLHGAGAIAGKLRKVYSKNGIKPQEIVDMANKDPAFKEKVLSKNIENPIEPIPKEIPKPKAIEIVKPIKDAKVELSDSAKTIMSKVVTKKQTKPGKPAPIVSEDGRVLKTNEFYTNFVDKLDPIKKATEFLEKNPKFLPASDNPYLLARLANDAAAKAQHFFEKGTIDFKTGEVKGKSLGSILRSVENTSEFEAFAISKRVLEKSGQGFKTGFDRSAAKANVKLNEAKYGRAFSDLKKFNDDVLSYVKDAGLLSDKALATIKELNKDYVPFKRIFSPEELLDGKGKSGKSGSLKKFKGSERSTQSPVISIVENTVDLMKLAENNNVKRSLVELALKDPKQDLIKKVPARKVSVTLKKETVAKELGISVEQAKDLTGFRAVAKQLAPNEFSVMMDGKLRTFEVRDKSIAEALSRLGGDRGSQNLAFQIFRGITTVKRFGITFTPAFQFKNLLRDTITSTTFSKKGIINPIEVVSAMGDILKKSDTYFAWLRSGGANGAFLEMSEAYIKKNVYGINEKTGLLNSARNVVSSPVELLRLTGTLSEQSLRLAEFKKVSGFKPGEVLQKDKLLEGGFAAREITLDFQRSGTKISALNAITAFQNASIQGLDKTFRAFREDPLKTSARAVTFITTPSILLWFANKDDVRYQELPAWQKDLFWIIPTDDWVDANPSEVATADKSLIRDIGGRKQINKGVIYRIPKPMELGLVFGSIPERALDLFFKDNPDSFRDFEESLLGLITPSIIPDAIAPGIEQYFNKNFFTDRPVTPHYLEKVFPEYRFTEYTSETAKVMGKLIASIDKRNEFASPVVLDNYIRSWSGTLGKYAIKTMDAALIKSGITEERIKASPNLSDIPFIDSFVVRYPTGSLESINKFRETFNKSEQVFATFQKLRKDQDFENLEKEFGLEINQDFMIRLTGINKALQNQSAIIRRINLDKTMSPDEKRGLIDSQYFMMLKLSKNGNEMFDKFKKERKSLKDKNK